MFFKEYFESLKHRIVTNLPFRMALGRLGIRLVEIGRFLQKRYANWNSEFRLKAEYCPNPDYLILHVSEPVTNEVILTFESPKSQESKRIPLVDELFKVKGIQKVTLEPYEISIKKSRVFEWNELLSDIEKVVLKDLVA